MGVSAQEAARTAGKGSRVIGWKLEREQRLELLQQFPPKYDKAVADHVTLAAKAADEAPLPCEEHAELIGRADDGAGVEALVVKIGGTSDRPDGSTYHITWSLGPGRRAVESNDVIRARGWEPVDPPITIKLEPAIF